ncbi:MAG: hypothetical protein ACYTEZ_04210 [Planctomycetota bacterium]|jgi:hypothetical protein
MRSAWWLLVLVAACAGERPIHPYRLEGFPGAPIEPLRFPLRAGVRWVFEDRVDPERGRLELAIEERDGKLVLVGTKQGEALIQARGGFLEIGFGDRTYRPLKLEGRVGDMWRTKGGWRERSTRYTVFGYDEVEVLGKPRRALVVAADRTQLRDLYWFVAEIGWVRIRTESEGRAKRDAYLAEFDPGDAN